MPEPVDVVRLREVNMPTGFEVTPLGAWRCQYCALSFGGVDEGERRRIAQHACLQRLEAKVDALREVVNLADGDRERLEAKVDRLIKALQSGAVGRWQ